MSAEATPRPGWLRRNWPWVLGLGCLLVILVSAAAIFGIFYLTVNLMRSSDAYQLAWQKVRTDPQVVAVLGAPVKEGWFVTGNVSVRNSGGSANLEFAVSGPNGKAAVTTSATRQNGVWKTDTLQVQVEGQPLPLILVLPFPRAGPPLPAEEPPAGSGRN
jgi:hypothetical protein